MNCPNCKNKAITTDYHDKKVLEGSPRELHRVCGQCGEVFIIYKNKSGCLSIRCRDERIPSTIDPNNVMKACPVWDHCYGINCRPEHVLEAQLKSGYCHRGGSLYQEPEKPKEK